MPLAGLIRTAAKVAMAGSDVRSDALGSFPAQQEWPTVRLPAASVWIDACLSDPHSQFLSQRGKPYGPTLKGASWR